MAWVAAILLIVGAIWLIRYAIKQEDPEHLAVRAKRQEELIDDIRVIVAGNTDFDATASQVMDRLREFDALPK